MKKEEMELKEVIKAAILEAFAEMYGVATTEETGDEAPKDDEGKKDESGKGGDSATSSGGGLNNGRPKPNVGVGGYSLR